MIAVGMVLVVRVAVSVALVLSARTVLPRCAPTTARGMATARTGNAFVLRAILGMTALVGLVQMVALGAESASIISARASLATWEMTAALRLAGLGA